MLYGLPSTACNKDKVKWLSWQGARGVCLGAVVIVLCQRGGNEGKKKKKEKIVSLESMVNRRTQLVAFIQDVFFPVVPRVYNGEEKQE